MVVIAWILACFGTPQDAVVANATLKQEAAALADQATRELGRELLSAVAHLPAPEARTLFRDPSTNRWLSAAAARALDEAARAPLVETAWPSERFYTTKYGSPLAYLRAIEHVAEAGGWKSFSGRRVLDFGYGTIGHLRLMAANGADVVGVDVDSFLLALYAEESDQGRMEVGEKRGSVQLVEGRWPTSEDVRTAVGGGFDLFLSKNTLKRGYLHPEREADPSRLIQLGVSDAVFLERVFAILNPGGLMVMYNLCPKQSPPNEPYIPWADGRCPFERELMEKTGFEILVFDRDDGPAARRQGRTLGWETAEQPLEEHLFAEVTVLRKPLAR